MTKHETVAANSGPAGGCCCAGKKNSARGAETAVETFPASDPPDRTLRGDEQAASSCCRSSKATAAKKEQAFFVRERPDLRADAILDGRTGGLIFRADLPPPE